MSLFTDASLVMIPSGIKDQKVYSVTPTDGSGDLTFSRGSDIEATRVNANGYIEKAQVNLLLQSNTFSNATWSITAGSSVTGGQSGYDGSSDAWLLTDSGFSAAYCLYQSYASSGVQTVSIYAKQGSTSQIEIDFFGGTGGYIRVELTDGSLHSTLNLIDYSVESVGGGWWRISFASNLSSTSLFRMGCNGAGSVYIQDAQVNYGLVAQEYQETTTAAVVSGITDNMPRLNYDPANPTCPSLLLEPSRQNLVESTEFFGASNWILNGSAITTNATTSPEGVANATKLEGDGSSVNVRLYDNYSYPSTGDYTFSVYAKAGTNDFVLISILGVDGGKARYFDLVNGIAGSTDSKIEAIGTDGWYRCSFTTTLTGPDITGNFNIYVPYSIDTTSFPTDADANGQYVYIYGAQLEQASYESSYIPCNGSSATRTADACSKTGISSLIGQTEGTLFCEIGKFPEENNGRILAISDGSLNNYITIIHNALQDNLAVYASSGGATQVSYTGSGTLTDGAKVAVGYKLNDYVIYINGTQVHTDTSAAVPVSPSNVYLGTRENGATTYQMGGSVSQALLFTSRLSNADLATLTSL